MPHIPPSKLGQADDPWPGNPAITLKQAGEAHSRGVLPATGEIAKAAAALMADLVPAKEAARILGYQEKDGTKLYKHPAVRSHFRQLCAAKGITAEYLAGRMGKHLDAKRTVYAQFKGEFRDERTTDDNATQLAALQLCMEAFDLLPNSRTGKTDEGSPKFVVNLGPVYEGVFFASKQEHVIPVDPIRGPTPSVEPEGTLEVREEG